jgi:hypothetical protein
VARLALLHQIVDRHPLLPAGILELPTHLVSAWQLAPMEARAPLGEQCTEVDSSRPALVFAVGVIVVSMFSTVMQLAAQDCAVGSQLGVHWVEEVVEGMEGHGGGICFLRVVFYAV